MIVQRLIVHSAASLLALGLVVVGCSSSGDSPAEKPTTKQQAVFSTDDPTSVTPGSATPPLTASCPGHKLPDQCGTWQGVELAASHTGAPHPQQTDDEHCLCAPIDFQLPATLPVSSGNAGIFGAKLSFRKSDGRSVECSYRGNARFGHSFKATGGDAYELDRCSDGSKAGASLKADWFKLEVDGSDPQAGLTALSLRLGEPDVVNGVVQEEIFYANDPRIPGAALHVPRGSAPDGQAFSLSVLPQVEVGSTIANAGSPFTTVGYAVDVHADGVDSFVFNNVPGAGCPRIELPYSPEALLATAGPDGESRLRARQITDLDGIASGAAVLASTGGGVTLDPAQHTASFCVQHLSFYVTGTNQVDAQLTSAFITELPGTTCTTTCAGGQTCILGLCYTDVLTAAPGPLKPSTPHRLRLQFQNESLTTAWGIGTIKLVSATPRFPVVSKLADSPWFASTCPALPCAAGTEPPTGFEQLVPGSVAAGGIATVLVDVTTPARELPSSAFAYGGALNLCLQQTPPGAIFGECFSWDYPAHSTSSVGATAAPLREVCDFIDNDGDDVIDNGVNNACGGCIVQSLPNPPLTACSRGLGVCATSGLYRCSGLDATICDASVVAPTTTVDTCGNGQDDNCNGPVDEGCICGDGTVAGSEQCDDGNTSAGDGCSPSCAFEPKVVFTTSQSFRANFGGLAAADAICQSLASTAGLSGTYKAWLSTTTISAGSRLSHSQGPYLLVNGVTVSANWTELTGGFLRHPIDMTELGGVPPPGFTDNFGFPGGCGQRLVWTNTRDDGSLGNNGASDCSGWTDDSRLGGVSGNGSFWGAWDETVNWSGHCAGGTCESTAPLFCFQQ